MHIEFQYKDNVFIFNLICICRRSFVQRFMQYQVSFHRCRFIRFVSQYNPVLINFSKNSESKANVHVFQIYCHLYLFFKLNTNINFSYLNRCKSIIWERRILKFNHLVHIEVNQNLVHQIRDQIFSDSFFTRRMQQNGQHIDSQNSFQS